MRARTFWGEHWPPIIAVAIVVVALVLAASFPMEDPSVERSTAIPGLSVLDNETCDVLIYRPDGSEILVQVVPVDMSPLMVGKVVTWTRRPDEGARVTFAPPWYRTIRIVKCASARADRYEVTVITPSRAIRKDVIV